ncbi:hypothetical protein BH23GEM9_BH23GEM9_22260 [soil metagenome]
MKRTATATAVLLLGVVLAAQAQTEDVRPHDDIADVAAVPFGPGERVTYRVTYGILGKRGEATSEVTGIQNVRGKPSYHLRFRLRGGVLGMNVNDLQESWLDVGQLYSHRFKQDLHQVRYERLRTLDFFPAERKWRRLEAPDSGSLATDLPLDDVSFLYWSRTLPMEVGRTYEFRRYYKDEGNPVIIRVIRRETITVPAGTFNTIVVKPLIRTSGLFGDGGEAEVYYTDDERRMIVMVKTKLSIANMTMQLESYTPGRILTPRAGPARP